MNRFCLPICVGLAGVCLPLELARAQTFNAPQADIPGLYSPWLEIQKLSGDFSTSGTSHTVYQAGPELFHFGSPLNEGVHTWEIADHPFNPGQDILWSQSFVVPARTYDYNSVYTTSVDLGLSLPGPSPQTSEQYYLRVVPESG